MGKGKVGEVSWREANLEWVEGPKPLHLTDKLAEMVEVVASTANWFTLNTLGETDSLVAREERRAEDRLTAVSSSRFSLVVVMFPSSGESFSKYQSLYSSSLVKADAQTEEIKETQVHTTKKQFGIFYS